MMIRLVPNVAIIIACGRKGKTDPGRYIPGKFFQWIISKPIDYTISWHYNTD